VAALKPLALAVALLIARPAAADPVDRWRAEIAEASARFGVPKAVATPCLAGDQSHLTRARWG
jgi:hypothetical protein